MKSIKLNKKILGRFSTSFPDKEFGLLNDLNQNPLLKSVFSKERIAKQNLETQFELSHGSKKTQILKSSLSQKLGENTFQAKIGKRVLKESTGFKVDKSYLQKTVDLTDREYMIQSYDFPGFVNKQITKLAQSSLWTFKEAENETMTDTMNSDKEYISYMCRVERNILNETEESLKENEIRVVNLPLNYSVKELKTKLNISSSDIVRVERDCLNQLASLTLSLKDGRTVREFKERFNDQKYNNCYLKVIDSNDSINELKSRKTIVLDGINAEMTREELLLQLGQFSKVKGLYFPEEIGTGKIHQTSEIVEFVKKNKEFDDLKIEINEFNGIDFDQHTIGGLSEADEELSSLGSPIGEDFEYANSITEKDYQRVKEQKSKNALKQIVSEINKKVFTSIKQSEHRIDREDREGLDRDFESIWEKLSLDEKIERVKLLLKEQIKKSKQLFPIEEIGNNDNPISSPKSKGFAVVEFFSVYEAKKAIYKLKSLSRFNDLKVDLLRPNSLFKYLPELKKSMVSEISQKNEKRQKEIKAILDEINRNKLDEADRKDIASLDTINDEAVKFLKQKELRKHLKESINTFITNNFYTDKKNLEPLLPPLEEIPQFMNRKGRQETIEDEEDELYLLQLRYKAAYETGLLDDILKKKALFVLKLESVG